MAQQPSEPNTGPPERLYDLDNFRIFLTALVIYHHTAIPYGGSGDWIYKSQFHTPESSPPLVAFNAINQTYFMGSFFFLSGYFSTKAFQRKGAKTFLLTKFIKLGIPTLMFTLFGGPAQTALIRWIQGQGVGWDVLLDHWRSLRGIKGPVWYLGLVLIFDTLYALAPSIKGYASEFNTLQAFISTVEASWFIRLVYPCGTIFTPLNLQLGYTAQYITAYFLGASLSTPTPPMTPTTGKVLLAASLLSVATAGCLLHYYPETYAIDSTKGGPNIPAFCYAVWNETTGYLLGTTILRLFKTRKILSRRWANFARYSYPAYLVHPIICVGLQALSDSWEASGVLKTAVLGTGAVGGSWVLGWSMVMIVPGAKVVLI